jgi:hypothetical protein
MKTEFHIQLNGLELPAPAKSQIEAELQKVIKREIAKLDLGGELKPTADRGFGGLGGGHTAGMVADYN